jgi:ligand-binding sensor domain-containing protein
VNYRGNGKAETQLKANHFFKKADTQTSSANQKMTPVVPIVSTQPPVTKNAETGLGVKRKREEIEAKFDKT